MAFLIDLTPLAGDATFPILAGSGILLTLDARFVDFATSPGG